MTNREYWVNVYVTFDLNDYYYKAFAAHQSYWWCNPCSYRLHIKLKDRPGLTRRYPLKMVDGMVTLNALPKYEEFDICGYRK